MSSIDHYAGAHTIVSRFTRTPSELRAALSNVKGEAFDQVRQVELHFDGATRGFESVDVRGPRDGRPLLINWRFGFVNLNVIAGNVVIMADSPMGHPIYVGSGAHVTVVTNRARKVSIEVADGGEATLVAAAGTHGHQSVASTGVFTVDGDDSRLTIRRSVAA